MSDEEIEAHYGNGLIQFTLNNVFINDEVDASILDFVSSCYEELGLDLEDLTELTPPQTYRLVIKRDTKNYIASELHVSSIGFWECVSRIAAAVKSFVEDGLFSADDDVESDSYTDAAYSFLQEGTEVAFVLTISELRDERARF